MLAMARLQEYRLTPLAGKVVIVFFFGYTGETPLTFIIWAVKANIRRYVAH